MMFSGVINRLKSLLKSFKKLTYISIGVWLLVAFVATVYSYNFYDLQLSKGTYFQYDKTADAFNYDSAFMDITSIKDGEFYGSLSVRIKSEEIQKIIKKGDAFYLKYYTLNGNPQYGDWVRLKSIEKKSNGYLLSSDKDVLLYSYTYELKYLPFEKIYLTFSPSIVVYDKDGSKLCDSGISHKEISLRVPFSYTIDGSIKNPEIIKIIEGGDGVFLTIKRQAWFLWLFGGILGFLLIPVIILIHADVKAISFDIIAIVISFMSVRSFFVGETKAVYPIDAYFTFLILFSGLIIMYKLYNKQL